MQRYRILAASFLFLLNGCLGFKAIEYRIRFDKKFETAKITITYEDIGSDKYISPGKDRKVTAAEKEEILQERREDFNDLLKIVQEDKQLLSALEQGIYLKKRYLFEKDGKLNGRYEGIFENLKFEDEVEALRVLKNEIMLTLKKDKDVERVESDGQVHESKNIITISWPKTQRSIYWRQVLKNEKGVVSLLDEYRKWKEKEKI